MICVQTPAILALQSEPGSLQESVLNLFRKVNSNCRMSAFGRQDLAGFLVGESQCFLSEQVQFVHRNKAYSGILTRLCTRSGKALQLSGSFTILKIAGISVD